MNNFDIDDFPDEDIRQYFDPVHALINQSKEKGESVLVVCTAGISRSATIVMSYLIKHEGMSLSNAYAHVKKA
jgi:protein-tyrosine phosphatase